MRFLFPSLGILFLLGLTLKLTGVLHWPWGVITAPLIIAVVLALALVVDWARGNKP